jgi:hypothetical protein
MGEHRDAIAACHHPHRLDIPRSLPGYRPRAVTMSQTVYAATDIQLLLERLRDNNQIGPQETATETGRDMSVLAWLIQGYWGVAASAEASTAAKSTVVGGLPTRISAALPVAGMKSAPLHVNATS